jgi:hypothetical protein
VAEAHPGNVVVPDHIHSCILQGNVRTADDGTPICQHGAVECELNMLLQCALAKLSPSEKSPPGEAPVAQQLLECFFESLLQHGGRADIQKQTAQTCIVAAGTSSIPMYVFVALFSVVLKNVLGRTFVMVQLRHSNNFGSASLAARLLFGFLLYFVPSSM